MWLVLGRSKRHAETDVHDANERIAGGKADHNRANESVSSAERFSHGRFLEFPGEEKNQAVQTATAGCAGRDLANAAAGYRSGAGISKMHRVFPLPGRLPRAARSSDARQIHWA